MKSFFAILLLTAISISAFAGDGLDPLLKAQRERAGSYAPSLFRALDPKDSLRMPEAEIADARFLLAYMPLSDLATLNAANVRNNVRLAEQARREMPWGTQVNDELFRYFVLPHRVSQEPFVEGWRQRFFDELAPRVKNLSMTDAALEVNHWCHEYVTYQPDDSRDQDPLTTMRAGLGRCEEEMIFTICALRSVGIPARQCYTPYWAHQDDNHAWVEVWADGKWHYYGACEPEPVLNQAWFSDPVTRAMLVVSTAYGDYRGNEPVLRRYGRTTLVNSTSVYGPTKVLTVRLLDAKGKAVPKSKIIFSLYNYGALMPATSQETDSKGEVHLTCGKGDWFVSAGKEDLAAFAHVNGADTLAMLALDSLDAMRTRAPGDYTPPPAREAQKSVPQDSLFKSRMAHEDSLRENDWSTWAREANITLPKDAPLKPDSAWLMKSAEAWKIDGKELVEMMRKARGNWGTIYEFLTGTYPISMVATDTVVHADRLPFHFTFLKTLTDKDLRDFPKRALLDHSGIFLLEGPAPRPREDKKDCYNLCKIAYENYVHAPDNDTLTRSRYTDYVLSPRLDQEPSHEWWQAIAMRFEDPLSLVVGGSLGGETPRERAERIKENRRQKSRSYEERLPRTSTNDAAVTDWLKKNIKVETDPDRLGPPLLPQQTLQLKRGTQRDLEVLYVALCRVRAIPARFDPVSDQLQRWQDTSWVRVQLAPESKKKSAPIESGFAKVNAQSDTTSQSSLYLKDWAVQMWDKDHFSVVDFGYHTAYKDIKWPQELPTGRYCLTTGIRRQDGSAPLTMTWFDVKAKATTESMLAYRQ